MNITYSRPSVLLHVDLISILDKKKTGEWSWPSLPCMHL